MIDRAITSGTQTPRPVGSKGNSFKIKLRENHHTRYAKSIFIIFFYLDDLITDVISRYNIALCSNRIQMYKKKNEKVMAT